MGCQSHGASCKNLWSETDRKDERQTEHKSSNGQEKALLYSWKAESLCIFSTPFFFLVVHFRYNNQDIIFEMLFVPSKTWLFLILIAL